ncbi:MAG: NADH-quinone oxidoreductase subunit J [Elusimicrobiota bacterium]|nr:NADH-quinone oxidoreductase subunit J [Elusimicrobiota bacterium]
MTLPIVLAAGALAVVFGVVMLLHRSLYVSAMCLLAVLLQTGVIFAACGAPLLGLLQVMIYAGAVMVLVVVTVMAAGGRTGPRFADFSIPRPLAWAGLAAALVEGAWLLAGAAGASPAPAVAHPALQLGLGAALFKPYAVATEAATLLMFLAALALIPEEQP